LRIAHKRSDPLKSFEESREIFIGIFLADFGFGENYAVSARQRANGRRLDRSFKMKVKFRKAGRISRGRATGGWFVVWGRGPISFRSNLFAALH
jgi:hypothetical protein